SSTPRSRPTATSAWTATQQKPRRSYRRASPPDGVRDPWAARGARGGRSAPARRRQAAGPARDPAPEREPGRLQRAAERGALGGRAAGNGAEGAPGARLAAPEG